MLPKTVIKSLLSRVIKSLDYVVKSLPNDKFLDSTNFKAFADDKSNVGKIIISLLDRVENIVGKGENAGYQHFLLFPHCFQKAASSGSLKVGLCSKGLNGMRGTGAQFPLKPFLNKPGFFCVITSNFFFFYSVFYPFQELFAIFVKFEIVVSKLFQFERV